MLHRDGVVDIAADHIEITGLDCDHDVAMARKAAGRQLVVGDRLASSPITDQIAALRGVDFDPLGRERGPRFEPEAVAPRCADVVGMRRRIRKAAAGSGDPHDI